MHIIENRVVCDILEIILEPELGTEPEKSGIVGEERIKQLEVLEESQERVTELLGLIVYVLAVSLTEGVVSLNKNEGRNDDKPVLGGSYTETLHLVVLICLLASVALRLTS